jgi:hypothetical protein
MVFVFAPASYVYVPSVREDLAEGFVFCEKQSSGLGSYFGESLFADIDSLALYGDAHPRVLGAPRQTLHA